MNKFEEQLRCKVFFANLIGSNPTPWEAVMEYVIALESRVKFLENRVEYNSKKHIDNNNIQ
jgi:hypothetical protein